MGLFPTPCPAGVFLRPTTRCFLVWTELTQSRSTHPVLVVPSGCVIMGSARCSQLHVVYLPPFCRNCVQILLKKASFGQYLDWELVYNLPEIGQPLIIIFHAGFSPRTNLRIGPIRNYFGPIRKKLADTHFFIPDTHNAVMMVWLRVILHDAACMSG